MCCCFSRRCSIISAGVWCLVQSIVWAALAFVGIAAYTCDLQIKPDITDPTYYLYFVYLFNRDCATFPDDLDFDKILEDFFTPPPGVTTPSNFTTPADFTTPFPMPSWPDKFAQTDYMHDVLQAYAGLNVAWAVICLITVVLGVMNVRRWFAYVPWILVTAANIVLDVVVTIKFASDAVVAMTPQGLIEEIIGVDLHRVPDNYTKVLYQQDVFESMAGLTAIPSIVMLLLSSRAVVFWLLNVLCLICVSVSICRFSKEKGKEKALTTSPYDRWRRPDVHNKNSYFEEPRSNGPDQPHEYAYAPGYSRPYSYTGGDVKRPSLHPSHPLTNNDLASSSALGNNLHSSTAQPYYTELQDPKPRYHAPSAPTDNYERQPPHRLPVPNDLQGDNGPDVRRRAPHIHRTDSEISSQPPIKNRPASNIVLPRVDMRSSHPEADPEYLEPRQGIYNTMPSADNYEQPPLPKLPVPGGVTGNNESAEQRKAPHVHRRESDRPAHRPQPSTTNMYRRSMDYEDVKPQERKSSQTPQDRTEDTNRNTGRRVSGSLPPDELRSQLPWSYFGPRDVPMKPKPKQDPVFEEELEMPPVPVPDYTLHFGKAARPANSQWSEDGASSSGPHAADHRGTSASVLERNRR